jgi:hypothetical protein
LSHVTVLPPLLIEQALLCVVNGLLPNFRLGQIPIFLYSCLAIWKRKYNDNDEVCLPQSFSFLFSSFFVGFFLRFICFFCSSFLFCSDSWDQTSCELFFIIILCIELFNRKKKWLYQNFAYILFVLWFIVYIVCIILWWDVGHLFDAEHRKIAEPEISIYTVVCFRLRIMNKKKVLFYFFLPTFSLN